LENTVNSKSGKKPPSLNPVSYGAIFDVLSFIKQNSTGGECSMSIAEIAERMGISTATVHRAIKKLQAEKLIDIRVSSIPTEPNTIVLLKQDERDMILKANELLIVAQENVKQVRDQLLILAKQPQQLSDDAKKYYQLLKAIVTVTPLSEGITQIIVKNDELPWIKQLLG
jgi:DNA-binding Lrp family transcriptional regulator